MFLKKYGYLALLLTACACGGDYEYKPLSAQEIPAAVQYSVDEEDPSLGGSFSTGARLTAVNGVSVSAKYLFLTFDSSQIMAGNRVLITPGNVTLTYEVHAENVNDWNVNFTFIAEPGEQYSPRLYEGESGYAGPLLQLVNSRGQAVQSAPVMRVEPWTAPR